MGKPVFVQLAQLENKLIRDAISLADYKQEKWTILQQILQTGESVNPVYKETKYKKEIADTQNSYFCLIPPGPFIYGEDNGYGESNAALYVAKYPVTVKQFMTFLEDSGWDYSEEDLAVMQRVSPQPDCPVSNVSWADAKQYCRWLRGKTEEYYSLPNESEWEYAARGIDGRFYPWGKNPLHSGIACYQGDYVFEGTVSVKAYQDNKSPFGCVGMVGNIWEWCLDVFDDPADPHIMRGGAWCHGAEYANCVARVSIGPGEERVEYAGFRVVYLPDDMLEEYQFRIQEQLELYAQYNQPQ